MTVIRMQRNTKNLILTLLWACLLLIPATAAAQESSSAIAQGFQADEGNGTVVAGALVSTKAGDSRTVELATFDSADHLVGVVDENPFVAISEDNKEVQVVLSGTTTVLVSDINGPIRAGDKITASPVAGVGMLATTDSQVVGTAQANFKTAGASKQTVKDRSGKEHQIHIGQVALQVGTAYYQAPGSNFLPPFLQTLANSIAGRPVSLVRVLGSSILLLLGFVSAAALIYASVRSSMTSLGRNPLAAHAIRKGLFQAALVAVVIVGGALLASYVVLSV